MRDDENLRERSCLLRCSLLLKARLQNWHLYFFSGADPEAFLGVGCVVDAPAAAGMVKLKKGGL
jgi:hypothetical protein